MQEGRRTAHRLRKAATLAAVMLAAPIVAFAQAGSNALQRLGTVGNKVYGSAAGQQSLPQIIGKIIQSALAFLGVVLVVIIIYAGFLWMTAQGAEEKVTKAKGMLANAVVGMLIIFAAYALTGFITGQIAAQTSGSSGTSTGVPAAGAPGGVPAGSP